MVRENPWLNKMTQVSFELDKYSSNYTIRKEPVEGFLSTLEALVYSVREASEDERWGVGNTGFHQDYQFILEKVQNIFRNVFDDEGSNLGITRDQLIKVLRESTGQYAIPAKFSSEAASLNIRSVIIPVLIAAVCILGIGLFLQRIWQKIDPE